jgi:hypothetical protein
VQGGARHLNEQPWGTKKGERQPWRCSAREKKGRAGQGAEASLGENVGLLKPGQRHGAPKKNQEGGSSWGGTLLPSAMDREGAPCALPCGRRSACCYREEEETWKQDCGG